VEDCAIACSKSLRATRMRLELCKYYPGRIRHDEADYVRPGLSNFRAPPHADRPFSTDQISGRSDGKFTRSVQTNRSCC